jgi:plasmid replication initiation protein
MVKKTAAIHRLQLYEADDNQRLVGDRWITMTNALTRAGQGLTLAEKRVVMLAVSTLDSAKPIKYGEEEPSSKVTASAYAAEFDLDMRTAYDQLQSTAKNLYERSINYFAPAYNRKGEEIKPAKVKSRWVYKIQYHEGEGWVELFWSPDILKHLRGIKKQFTSYQLKHATALRSIYSWRLLELITRFESTGWAEYTVEDFAASMDATDKQKSNFNNIKRRIIEPAVKELIEKDNWLIEWKPIKTGKKVMAIRFDFERNPQRSLF